MKDNVAFMTVAEFKAAVDVATIEVVKNPNTGKLFCAAGEERFKCQQDIDLTGSMAFLLPLDKAGKAIMEQACLVNRSANNVLATL
jgi:hypothetical protein